jgi:hypothetical protein
VCDKFTGKPKGEFVDWAFFSMEGDMVKVSLMYLATSLFCFRS